MTPDRPIEVATHEALHTVAAWFIGGDVAEVVLTATPATRKRSFGRTRSTSRSSRCFRLSSSGRTMAVSRTCGKRRHADPSSWHCGCATRSRRRTTSSGRSANSLYSFSRTRDPASSTWSGSGQAGLQPRFGSLRRCPAGPAYPTSPGSARRDGRSREGCAGHSIAIARSAPVYGFRRAEPGLVLYAFD